MRSHSYINTAKNILQSYNGKIPFAAWLKQFFAANKKYGSTDRKIITHICYSFYRLGHALVGLPVEEKIITSLYLCSTEKSLVLKELRPEWNDKIELSLKEKIGFLNIENEVQNIFPWQQHLSSTINPFDFSNSFLLQPLLYLRIRPGYEAIVKNKLTNADIYFNEVTNNCLAIANTTKIDALLEIDKEVVIQDLSSQQTLNLLLKIINKNKNLSAWDCCAASGGKSLLLKDKVAEVNLTVSDIRESILANLKKRFERAGLKNYNAFVKDISAPDFASNKKYDVVICDAPCTGSGTWSRTPEQLYFFEENKVEHYKRLQKQIAKNASAAVKPNGFFVYITCSVFKQENEEVVEYISENTNLNLVQMQYIKGYLQKADTLFTALFSL